ncbi:glycosyltransferase family 2 protein [Methylobacterium soli]|uniref:Glycosyltransferase n=2 Tax=Methylobacterium soli TaxID=553447 RepID=A0A6L3T4B3_9HYPH|nr:glycosyltransferase family 2 protein [Methylobacterium soli]KAB1081131.1 glycosyltransferase [Methylobacterium soli]
MEPRSEPPAQGREGDDLIRPRSARPWLGRQTDFHFVPTDDPVFDRSLVIAGDARDGWIVLSYRTDPTALPTRPMLRLIRADGSVQDFVLPGVTLTRAHWLGLLPSDVTEIRLAVTAGSGFSLERVGLRSHASLFCDCLVRRPLRAVAALYERMRRDERRFRDILRGACAVTPSARFPAWAAGRDDRAPATRHASGPKIRVLIPVRSGEGRGLSRTIESLRAQTHADWTADIRWENREAETGIPQDGRVSHAAWQDAALRGELAAEADALCLLIPGETLDPDALALLAHPMASRPELDLIYADAQHREGLPALKPDWSPDLARVTGYFDTPALLSRGLIAGLPNRPVGPIDAFAEELRLGVASAARHVVHIPRVLCRTPRWPSDLIPAAGVLSTHLAAIAAPAETEMRGGSVDLRWRMPQPAPAVSIVIPSRDRFDLISRVCRGLLHETHYPAIEIIIVDNGSTDAAVLDFYRTLRRDPRVQIIIEPAPFNFSAMVNRGAAAATGDILVLLNNDVAILEATWLDAMVRQAARPEIGAVGAKLLYGNGTLQHAGVVVGLGGRAGHILRRRPAGTPGRLGRLRVAHEVSAVTAACLAVSRDKYEAVGGFDAEAFPIDFNDVDFCLRLGQAGYRTIWTPAATLAHLESVSRGPAVGEARQRFEREADRFVTRWRDVIRHDPYYHPALSLTTFGEDLE